MTRSGNATLYSALALACALAFSTSHAFAGVKEKIAAMAPSGLILVVDEKGNELVVQNADKPFVPASVTKIVTAWLAMEVLGPDYRFETQFYLDKDRVLYVRGGGDPFLISEELASLAKELVAAIGKEPITGIVLDASYYPSDLRIPRHREHQRVLRCAQLRARGELQHCRRRAQGQHGSLRRGADADHAARH
jgi:D-alanyl-D-alanine carboxypeptidase/D-alanyl-D-alanine-endopeptidase (penicillin-binding protein 4)